MLSGDGVGTGFRQNGGLFKQCISPTMAASKSDADKMRLSNGNLSYTLCNVNFI